MAKYFERGLNIVSGLITTVQYLVTLVKEPSNDFTKFISEKIKIISILSKSIQDSSAFTKFIIFLLLEIANAYFFAYLFKKIKQSDNHLPATISLYMIVISLTVFITHLTRYLKK